jgi:hypothetical protein
MRIFKKQMTIDEIEREIINIKQQGGPRVIEDKKIHELLQMYYYEQKDIKMTFLAKTLTKNVSFILKKRNMSMGDFATELERKSGQIGNVYRSKEMLKPEYYRTDNLLGYAFDFAFGLNISPWDLLFHDVEYLISKNMLSTF